MMHEMVVDDLMEEVTANKANRAVNSAQCPKSVCPGLFGVEGNIDMCMVEVSNGNCGC